ncbi:MAG TPA: hypothetical protein VHB98_01655 [Chloroflexota bacterium]|nr:hypothetical protein [Chloroflexota bacterium]
MGVKVFLGTIAFAVFITITGLAYWFFPILSSFHEAMGGGRLKDPRGSWQEQLNTWLSFLPDNMVERALMITAVVAGYILFSTITTMLALRWRRRGEDRALQKLSRARAVHAYNARR